MLFVTFLIVSQGWLYSSKYEAVPKGVVKIYFWQNSVISNFACIECKLTLKNLQDSFLFHFFKHFIIALPFH